ncbi:DL-endopeptidase inhibitor IseA family protein [Sporosarcina oncorhynchi]|uniref:DL-endopeptidase inhibitor IseA family protein n=1 Tax=Sporosarcina oncorhynchi TaxID=3056444 RepID=A0ABZ0L6S6_9BACL|nr:DL-endopeptidase inhibitor IseA family protein [Sporosarcina sp. T2O-4]WOV88269.1 DL-endopeptidase inhibitor IseA family protein [Sporosarcina sp. T2O-4]
MRTKLFSIGVLLLLFLAACGGPPAGYVALSPKSAVELAAGWAGADSVILSGGLYKEGEYVSFTYKGMEYRYMAGHLDSKKKLKAELHKFITKKKAKRYMKEYGILKHKGKLAQPEVEKTSQSQWEMATAKEVKSKKNYMLFEITVPIGDTRTAEKIIVKYVYLKKTGWRIDKFNE